LTKATIMTTLAFQAMSAHVHLVMFLYKIILKSETLTMNHTATFLKILLESSMYMYTGLSL